MPARILRWTVCLVLVLGAAACGGDDGGDGGTAGTSSAAATPSATATAAGAASESSGGGSGGGGGTYTVRSGDTLSAIARQHGTTVDALVEANDIADPDVIDVGQELTIPSD